MLFAREVKPAMLAGQLNLTLVSSHFTSESSITYSLCPKKMIYGHYCNLKVQNAKQNHEKVGE